MVMGTDIHGIFQRKVNDTWEDVHTDWKFGRHYMLFAWLADVRNGFGFAGCPTHVRIDPLPFNAGYPEDFDVVNSMHPIKDSTFRGDVAKYYVEDDANPDSEFYLKIWMGDHSHAWINIDEILKAPLPMVLRTGIITLALYKDWDGESAPEVWCGGISGENLLVSFPNELTDKTTHVRVEWFVNTKDEFEYFIEEVQRLKNLYGEVRFVYGFDS